MFFYQAVECFELAAVEPSELTDRWKLLGSGGTTLGGEGCFNLEDIMARFAMAAVMAATLVGSTGMAFCAETQSGTSTPPATRSFDSVQIGVYGMSDMQIRQQLETLGYTVQSLKHQGGRVEAMVAKDGQTAELRVDPQTGAVNQVQGQDEND